MALIVYSGGLDSTVLLYLLKSKNEATEALLVDYGQKHRKEIDFAIKNCKKLNVPYNIADLSSITHLFGKCSLTNKDEQIPTGNYDDSNMKSTVVPNRNMILISIATARAIAVGTNKVAYAAHSGDHAIYPDCRNEFTNALDNVMRICHYDEITLYRPFINFDKAQIVKLGAELEVDFSQTWSCYNGDDFHCGKCGTCMERREAFQKAQVPDPTIYR